MIKNFLGLLLLSCTMLQTHAYAWPTEEPQETIVNPDVAAVAEYPVIAKTQTDSEKQQSLLSAAGRLIFAGQWEQGQIILAQTHALTAIQKHEKNILLAKIDMIQDKSNDALIKLEKVKNPDALSTFHQMQFYELLAHANRVEGNLMASIADRILLERLLTEEKSYAANQKMLWRTLTSMQPADLETFYQEAVHHSELQGWLQLALIARKYRDNSKSLVAALDSWQNQFQSHPANHMLPNPLDSVMHKILEQPKQIALLLPTSGALSGPGIAIQEGFMAAYRTNKGEATVISYDTEKGDILATYQRAMQEGADYIIGPLTKPHVASIAAIPHPVPTLLLNDTEATLQDNSYKFGLSPVDEARQVAIKARSKGYRKALMIVPEGTWGSQIANAFIKQWEKKEGLVVDTLEYTATMDMPQKIRELLQITKSEDKVKRLQKILGLPGKTASNRRQDFDMVFLLAYPSKAREIVPLLKYYYAGDVPVFATSSVYSGTANPMKDKDIDGVVFCDMPWVFSHQLENKNWPEQFNSYTRLYALGVDSYALAVQLNQLLLFPAFGLDENNGVLYLKSPQQVARVFEWGQFKQGLVHSLGEG